MISLNNNVMPGLDPGIHVFFRRTKAVDGRVSAVRAGPAMTNKKQFASGVLGSCR